MPERWEVPHFSTDRLKTLTDGVIAIVITLLVLELSVPVVKELPHSDGLWPEVRGLWREYLAYVVSFFIVGLLWLYHHNVFRHIKAADGRLLLLNMFYLLAVSIMPFSSALVAKNSDERLAAVIYGASLFLAAASMAAIFAYASYRKRLVDENMTDAFIRRENITAAAVTILLAIAAVLGIINAAFTYIILALVGVFYWLIIAFEREGVSFRRRT
ncbi:MAG: TMEM175 family protein [Acidimicrobiia bacterium]|nr:TMEM175 family protein [Acidimicrobiia bacterium]